MKSTPNRARNRRVAAVATGALVALTGALISASAANAVTQTPDPAENFSVLKPSNPANRINVQDITVPGNSVNITDANGKTVVLPKVGVGVDNAGDPVFPADPNNINGLATNYGIFYFIPSTGDLEPVGINGGAANGAVAINPVSQPTFYNAALASSTLEALNPGTEFDVLIADTPFNADGTQGDRSVLAPNEGYYELQYQYNGLNTTTGNYETGPIGSTANQPAAATDLAVSATASSTGIALSAQVEDPSNGDAVDSTATGTVTFSAAGLSDVTGTVTNGVATATIPQTSLAYSTQYTFTANYAGDSKFLASTGTAMTTTVAAPANSGQAQNNETVTIAAATGGTLTLNVDASTVAFGTASQDLVKGTFNASAALPTTSVADTRVSKGDWTLNGSSTALKDAANDLIPASDLSWSAPSLTGSTASSGATAGSANRDLTNDTPLASFHDNSLLGEVDTDVATTLALTTPINQAAGNYAGTLTITLI